MNEKHQQVTAWLENIFGSDNVPQYEVDVYTVERLYNMMKVNEEQDDHAALLIDDLFSKTEEYKVENCRLHNILNKLGLLPNVLSQSGTSSLSSLAKSAITLELSSASETNFLLAMSELSQRSMKITEERHIEQRLISQFSSKTIDAKIKTGSLERTLAGLQVQADSQSHSIQNQSRNAAFLSTKSREYRKNVESSQKQLGQNKVEPSIYHSTLLKKSEELKTLREQLHPLKSKLKSYHQLPPDMSLAKVKVEEIKHELEKLEEELAKRFNLMQM